MRTLYFAFFCLLSSASFGQQTAELTPQERAYLYHAVKKSPILEGHFGRYFDYQGPMILFPNKKINFDSVEVLMVNNPELLVIRREEIAKSPKGLVAEVANKMALWELNKVLFAKLTPSKEMDEVQTKFEEFEAILMDNLPPNATKMEGGVNKPLPRIYNIINPNLSYTDQFTQLESLRFLDQNDQLVTLKAIRLAINSYVEKRSLELYTILGGQSSQFANVVIAAGDGTNAGTIEDREKDENNQWNMGLPKSVGLFPYVTIKESFEVREHIEIDGSRTKIMDTKLEPRRYTVSNFKTAGNNALTNVHVDIWGYNPEKQTTVVIEKNGLNYHLFNSGDDRFLSPDSTFNGNKTFQAVINDLEFHLIADLNEMIYGKKGFDYWIDYHHKEKDKVELKIEKREKEYSDLGYSPITTSSKPSHRVKKSKRKAIKNGTVDFDATPTTDSGTSQRKKLQNEIVHLYGLFEAHAKKIKELEQQKEEAIDLMALYQRKLDIFKQSMGIRWATYTEENGLYTFEDSTIFDYERQEFQFMPKREVEDFEIRLIAIPETTLAETTDEVMAHYTVIDAIPHYDARINLQLTDQFEQDAYKLSAPLFTDVDSVSLRVAIESLLDKKMDFDIQASGHGIGKWNGTIVVKEPKPSPISSYKGSADDLAYAQLRKSEVLLTINRSITLEINSFTDQMKSGFNVPNAKINAAMTKYGLSKNDALTAYRTAELLRAFEREFIASAKQFLSVEEAEIIVKRVAKAVKKAKVNVGGAQLKMSLFE